MKKVYHSRVAQTPKYKNCFINDSPDCWTMKAVMSNMQRDVMGVLMQYHGIKSCTSSKVCFWI